MARVRVAVLGAGWWSGRAHLPALAGRDDVELVAVCDADAGRAREAAELFGAGRAVTAPDELLDLGVDGVVVATPHDQHHAAAAPLLDAGVDVLLEKPMTVDPAEAWDLVDRAARSGARLHVGYPFLHAPHAAALRELVDQGRLGDLVLVTGTFATAVDRLYHGETAGQEGADSPFSSDPGTYADPRHGGGQRHTQLTHAVSLVLGTCRLDVTEVTGHVARRDLPVDVADVVGASTRGGTLVSWSSTGTVHDQDLRVERYEVFGTEGHARLDTREGTLAFAARGGDPTRVALPREANPVEEPAAALVDSLRHGRPPVVDGTVGARTVEVLWAAGESARRRCAVAPDDWRPEG